MKTYQHSVIAIILGILLGAYSYFSAIHDVNTSLIAKEFIFYESDVLNKIFVPSHFNNTPYLDKESPFILLHSLLFYFFGLMIGSMPFLMKKKSQHQFLALRFGTQQKLLTYIKGHFILPIIGYTWSHLLIMFMLIHYHAPYDADMTQVEWLIFLILFGVCRVVLLIAIVQLAFILYIKFTAVVAQLGALLAIIVLFMVDRSVPFVTILFFDRTSYYVDGMLLGVIGIVSIQFLLKKIVYEVQ